MKIALLALHVGWFAIAAWAICLIFPGCASAPDTFQYAQPKIEEPLLERWEREGLVERVWVVQTNLVWRWKGPK